MEKKDNVNIKKILKKFEIDKLDKKDLKDLIEFAESEIKEWVLFINECNQRIKEIKAR